MSDLGAHETTSAPAPHGIGLVVALVVSVLSLYGLARAFESASCQALMLVIGFAALPIWCYQTERVLLPRRTFIDSVSTDTSSLRRRLWRGQLTSILQLPGSIVMAALLLGVLTALQPGHWVVLFADAVLLGMIFHPIRRSLAGQILPKYQSIVARRWPLVGINVAVLAVSIVALEFYVIDQPGTRGLAWDHVASRAFNEARLGTTCPIAGVFLGLIEALDRLAWHAAMSLIPGLPSVGFKEFAWVVFLLWKGFGAYLFTRCLLGVSMIFEERTPAARRGRRISTFSYAFWITILTLAAVWMYGTYIESLPPEVVDEPSPSKKGPCSDAESDSGPLQADINGKIGLHQRSAYKLADEHIDSALARAFSVAEGGADRYLDWYFSLLGEYTRLGTAVTGNVDQLMQDQLSKHLFGDTNFEGLIAEASEHVEMRTIERMTLAAEEVGVLITKSAKEGPCPIRNVDPGALEGLKRDQLRAGTAVILGAGTATTLASKPAAAVTAKLVTKSGVKTAGSLLAKVGAKKVTSVSLSAGTGALICSPAGPVAVLCGAVAGFVVWIAVDKAAIEVDELLFREQMRKELLAELVVQKENLRADLKAMHQGIIDAYALQISTVSNQVFNPARDGL